MWAIVPHFGGEAACKFQGMSDIDGILEMDLTVDDATDQTVYMVEDETLILLELSLEFGILLIRRELDTSELGLDEKAAFVR